jgi:hypothetical protein
VEFRAYKDAAKHDDFVVKRSYAITKRRAQRLLDEWFAATAEEKSLYLGRIEAVWK